ncbi:MAG: right-handed parallel beta-helix repeat-containing protein, partial [bacterium]
MKKIIFLLVLLVVFSPSFGKGLDYVVYKKGNSYIAKQITSGKITAKDINADVVIQQLLNNLQGLGGNIDLMSGKYPIKTQLKIPSHVTISGKGSSTVVLIEKTAKIESAFYSDSTNKVTIKELTISSENPIETHSGIIFNHVGDCLVKDVSISGMGGYGIWYRDRTFLSEIRGCKISGSGKSGIFLQGLKSKSRAGDFVPNLITNCIIYGGNYGIELEHSLVTNIISCEVYMTKSIGFYLHSNSNSTLINGCRTFQIQNDAVRVVDSHELNVSSNIFCWHDGHGIVLDNVIWGNVNGNNFIDNGHINIVPKDGNVTSYMVLVPDSINVLDSLKCGIFATNETKG